MVCLNEEDASGTMDFHIKYCGKLKGKYVAKYTKQPHASPASLERASHHAASASQPMSSTSASQPNDTDMGVTHASHHPVAASQPMSPTSASWPHNMDMPAACNTHDVVGHFLACEVAHVIFFYLMPEFERPSTTGQELKRKGAEKRQQGLSLILESRRRAIVKFVVRRLRDSPAITWNGLVEAVTEWALKGRTEWRWKRLEADSNDPHVITLNNELGLACAHDLLHHVKEKGDDIREAVIRELQRKKRKNTDN